MNRGWTKAASAALLSDPMSSPISAVAPPALHRERSREGGKARHPLIRHFPHGTGPEAHHVTLFAAMVIAALLVTLSGLIGVAEILHRDLPCSEEGIACHIGIGARDPTTPKPAG